MGHICAKNVKARFPDAFYPRLLRPDHVDSSAPPPSVVVQMPSFLSKEECLRIIEAGESVAATGQECEEYLNARVNNEVSSSGTSEEAKQLIDECKIEMSDDAGGGFRVRLGEDLIKDMLEERVSYVMGLEGSKFFFEEGAWERPTPRRIIIRDQTMVKYGLNDGVPPHVDGKDATLLIYLNDVPEGSGGRTVFPEDGLAVPPTEGTALLYKSKVELLHFSEPVEDPSAEKYILQLLIDYVHDYKKGDKVVDFKTGESYIYE
eukprot:CAMPEP_0118638350 /NCGR_PEP_ID=MMETSP0785-20121206/3633_1 /TAXON_ID=91992 /ORGANISM="Bolidomonas pacifica, Strain CCMP 1866" /LENGTH=261 /DNA_ID=CAMNT_0006529585 /DNA_START=264 /DNA_END=1049 /DNA_ORIENTATION=-